MDKYSSFSELSACERRGVDYEISVRPQLASSVAVIAPHGGGIEPRTAGIAKRIAGDDFSFYSFRGLKHRENRNLHITSHKFDEPKCLGLVAEQDWVLAIHGCRESEEQAFLGGLDRPLICDLESALLAADIDVQTTGHPYPAIHPRNICNRGSRRIGAQFELTKPFRQSKRVPLFVKVVREVLSSIQSAA
jgi:phage replication-related protein YjqB (UPF0714/DUF867 family)